MDIELKGVVLSHHFIKALEDWSNTALGELSCRIPKRRLRHWRMILASTEIDYIKELSKQAMATAIKSKN